MTLKSTFNNLAFFLNKKNALFNYRVISGRSELPPVEFIPKEKGADVSFTACYALQKGE